MTAFPQHLYFGIVGGGGATQRFINAIEGVDDVSICAVKCRPEELVGRIPSDVRVESYSELLRRTDINSIYLATPVHTHVPMAIEAVAAGKYVLIEKPMALSLCDLESLEQSCNQNAVVGAAFKKRFGEGIEYLRDLDWDFGRETKVVYRWHVPFPAASNWRHRPELAGGGVVMDLGSHIVDLFEYLFGPIVRIQARTTSKLCPKIIESAAMIDFEFRSGGTALVDISWHALLDAYEFHIQEGERHFSQTKVSTEKDKCNIFDGKQTRDFLLSRVEEYRGLLKAFSYTVNGYEGRLPLIRDGKRNLEVIQAIYEAAELKQTVEL